METTTTTSSVFGLGFVGGAIFKSLKEKGGQVVGYDKYKDETVSSEEAFKSCLSADIAFLCLPTVFDEAQHSYDQSCIKDVCNRLVENSFKGAVVIKSTVEPGTTDLLCQLYPSLAFIHNPEFLTAATAYEDFHNQKHIVLGKSANASDDVMDCVSQFYAEHYPEAEISLCLAIESESMKIYVNCFYATKIQFFNELYALTNAVGGDFNIVVKLMLKNKWINAMHTSVPGTDGMLSYGGGCFPKDTNALLCHMKKSGTPHQVITSVIAERNEMRTDHTNVNVIPKVKVETVADNCCNCKCKLTIDKFEESIKKLNTEIEKITSINADTYIPEKTSSPLQSSKPNCTII
jgi:nucleotide sugar dehydrogenase